MVPDTPSSPGRNFEEGEGPGRGRLNALATHKFRPAGPGVEEARPQLRGSTRGPEPGPNPHGDPDAEP